eukprot:CAMPEP_0172322546 /NCGR_PEP_ID=MMETSP1058-20130122/46206_1 /TAXON_ID=83371 /ORGANISM="Detonula confervacea, Strain CCMP 353" /LENGTH=414 /DNA_ID=CAMNT_0013038313 /DNA_START=6 /DNA_END=1250 /DNA_ORIENTATION=-
MKPFIGTLSTLFISCLLKASVVSAFSGTFSSRRSFLPLSVSSTDTTAHVAASEEATRSNDGGWATHALLFSSLSDGVIPNTAARSFLRYSLANSLLSEHITQKEDTLKSSAEFSPCNGPNVDVLDNLEAIDRLYERGQKYSSDDFGTNEQVDFWATEALKYLCSDTNNELNVRVLYIPTASYALNPQSSNTAGKQRQRARADGKKRRTQLLNLLGELLSSNISDDPNNSDGQQFKLLSTTLDLDDGSLKQPVGSDDSSLFPENDKAALSTWNPHLIYVEGGNTFWLQHCIDKGDYSTLIKDACVGPLGAVYCGKSAGAIVGGSNVATATWKGWDDPSVVPGKESYDDWLDCQGFEFVGNQSLFPHMSDDWKDMVTEKVEAQNLGKSVYCLREEDVCCVVGDKKLSFVASGPSPQ